MELIVLRIALQTVRMTCVTMLTERVPVNLDGKGSTAAKVNIHLGFLIQNLKIQYFCSGGRLPNS